MAVGFESTNTSHVRHFTKLRWKLAETLDILKKFPRFQSSSFGFATGSVGF